MSRTAELIATGEVGLILAAERLFAERGIEGVSLRQVNQAANQKNISAAHYHFGSRDGLVEAVLMFRLPQLDRRRGELLRRGGGRRDLRFYLEAFIVPLIDELQPRPEGNHYIRFMRQYERYVGNYEFVRQISPAGVDIYAGLERLLGYLPADVRRLRIGYLINMIHAVLATVEERLGTGRVTHAEISLTASNLLDMVAAALTSPVSAETMECLDADGPHACNADKSHIQG